MNKVFFRRKKIIENQENIKGPKKSKIRFFSKRIFSGIFLLSLLYITFASVRFITGIHNQSIHKAINNSAVLGTSTTNAVNELGNVAFNIPAFFNAPAEFKKSLTVDGSVLFNNNVKLNNKDLDLGTGIVTAANLNNLINGLTAGTGITVSTGNSPTITNTGVLSVQGQTGAVTFTAGSGLSLTGTAISNIGVTSFQGSTGSITLTPGTNISISGTTITDTLASNLTNNGIVYANSGSTITSLTPAAAGYILQSNGTGTAPSWSTSLALGGSLSNSTLAGANAVLYGAPTTGLFSIVTTTTGSQCLLSASGPSGEPSWGTCALGTNFWQLVSGVLSPATISNDLAIGGTATSSALFQVFATTGNATSSGNFTFNSAASLQTTANQSLTFGGATTGNIILDPLNGIGNVGIDTTGPKATFDVVGSTNNGSVDSFRVESNNRNGYLYANYVATAATPYVTMGGWNLLTSSFAPIQTPKGFYIGLNTTPPASPGLLNVEGNASGNAAAVINQYGAGDIFTASQSGKTEFVITHNGYVGIGPSYVADDNNGAGGSSGISLLSVTDTTSGKYLKFILNGPATNGGTAIEFMTNGATAADLVYDKSAGSLQLNNREPNQPIVFQTFNSGEQERMRIDQNGMVGIGNTLMGNTSLVVNQPNNSGDIFSASASGTTQFTVQHNGHVIIRNGADSGYPDSSNGLVTIDGQGGAGGIPSLVLENSPQDIGFPSGDNLQIGQWDGTTWNERLRINDGGNVGVGTTTPGSKLEVNGNITAKIPNGQGQVIAYGPNGSTYMYMQVDSGNSNGYIAMNGFTSPLGFSGGGNTVFEPNQGVFKVDGNTYTNSLSLQQNDVTGTVNNTYGVLTLQSDQTIVVNKNGPNTFDIFSASSSGSPKFVINNAGNVGVGTATPAYPLEISSTAKDVQNGAIESIDGNLTSTTNTYTSGLYVQPEVNISADSSQTYLGINAGVYSDDNLASTHLANASMEGLVSEPDYAGTHTLGTLSALHAKIFNLSSGTITNAYGVYVDGDNTGTITNDYGMYISAPNGTVTNKYALIAEAGAGNVGIGTTSPTTHLFITNGNSSTATTDQLALGSGSSGYLRLGTDNSDNSYIAANATMVGSSSTWNYVSTGAYSSSATAIQMNGNISFRTATGGTNPLSWNTRLFIANGGNIGIDNNSPTASLDVTGNASESGNLTFRGGGAQQVNLLNGSSLGFYTSPGGDANLGNYSPPLYINGSTLAVGIGTTTTPVGTDLDISGNTVDQGQLSVTDSLSATNYVASLKYDSSLAGSPNNITRIRLGGNSGPNGFGISDYDTMMLFVTNNGNVDIGTNNTGQNATLDTSAVNGTLPIGYFHGSTSFAGLEINNTGVGDLFTASQGGNTKFVINNAGNVGVGTMTPNNSIQVANLINFDGSNNGTYLGYHAGNAITNSNSSENTLVGVDAGYQTTTGYDNAALGMESLYANTTGYENVALGAYSLYDNTTGSDNVSVGYKALYVNTTGQNNVALGVTALEHNTTGIQNVALGSAALQANTTGDDNYGLGSYALYTNTTGSRNIAVGSLALNSNLSGSDSVAFGHEALRENTTGHDNTGLGNYALYSNTTGFYNTSVGDSSLEDNLIGINNASLGFQSLYYNTASNSSALGANALIDNTTGTDNVAMGYNAGYTNNSGNANTTGSFNTFIGDNAGPGISTQLTNATAIGANATVNQSNSLILGSINGINGSTSSTGVGIGVQSPIGGLDVEGAFAGQALMTLNYTGSDQNIFTASKSGTTKFVIDHNGNVGIGTTSPTQKLDISGGNAVFDSGYGIYSRGGGGTSGYLILTGDETGTILRSGDNDAADGISFQSFDGTTRMFIGSGSSYAGNVGIGTITPSAKLELAGTTGLNQATGTTPSLLAADDGNNTNIFQVTATGGIEQMGSFNSPFGGIGFYENLLAYSQGNFSGGSYTAYWTKPTTTDNTTDVQAPDGSYTATKAVLPSSLPNGSEGYVQFTTPSPVTGQPWTDSIWLRGAAGGEQVQIGSDDENLSSTFTLTKTWKRYNYSTGNRVSSTQNRGFEIQFLTPSSTAYLWGAQAERRSFPGVYVATTANAVVPSPAGYNSGFIVNATGSAIFNGNIQMNNSTAQIIGPSGTYGINLNSGGIGSNLYALQLSRSSGTSYTQPDIIGSSNGLVIGGLSGSIGTIALNTSGSSTPTMYLTGGNVGIGTTGPKAQLDISQVGSSPNSLMELDASSGWPWHLIFNRTDVGSSKMQFWDDNGGNLQLCNNSGQNCIGFTQNNGLVLGSINSTNISNVSLATLDTRATQYTTPVASISGATGKATLVLDQSGGINGGDIFAASASGLNRFVIQQDGNVGIGTTTPGALLDVNNNSDSMPTIRASDYGTATTPPSNEAAVYGYNYWNNGYAGVFKSANAGTGLYVSADGTGYGLLVNQGNVGVGTTTPNGLLSLGRSVANKKLLLYDDGTYTYGLGIASGEMRIFADSTGHTSFGLYTTSSNTFTEQMRLDNNGRLGIGTTSPTQLLQVNDNTGGYGGDPTIQVTENNSRGSALLNLSQGSQGLDESGIQYQIGGITNWFSGIPYNCGSSANVFIISQQNYISNCSVNNTSSLSIGLNNNTVGIGTNTPGNEIGLDIEKNTANISLLINQPGRGTLFSASQSGNTKFVIDNSGNVGVGTTIPLAEMNLNNGGTANADKLLIGNYTKGGFIEDTGSAIDLGTTGNTALYINAGGNNTYINPINGGLVGIGNNNPLATFDVRANSGTVAVASVSGQTSFAALTVDNSGVGDLFTASSSSLNRFVITQSGNVGVGTTTPGSLLDIVPSNSSYNDELRVYSPDKSEYMGFTWDTAHVGLSSSGQSIDLFNSIYNAGGIFDNGNYGMNDISQLGVGTTQTALATADFRSTNGTIPVASISGKTSFASLVVDQSGVGDLFTASTAGLTRFRIDNTGNTSIFGASLCVKSNNTPCAGTTPGTIYASNQTVQAGDVAENYISAQALAPGDIVMPAGDGNNTAVVKTTSSYQSQAIGIVSTDPGVTLNSAAETDSTHPNKYPIALAGRVPVKVTTANGVIHTGDLLTTSAQPGVAQKATQAGVIIGKALEDYTNTDTTVIGKIMIYVNISWGDPTIQFTADGNLDIISSNSTASANGPVASVPVSQLSSTDINSQVAGLSNTVVSMQNQIASITAQMTKVQNISDITTQINALEKQVNALNILNATSSNNILATTDATISGSLSVTGETLLSQVGITGNLSMGLLQISGGTDTNNQPAINTLSGPLQLQSDGLNGLDILNGKITIAATGDIRAIGSITAKKYNVDTTDNSSASVGEGTIPSGTTYVVIKTTAVTGTSKIFVTPHIPAVLGVTAQSKGKSFTVTIDNPQSQAIQFDWWVIN